MRSPQRSAARASVVSSARVSRRFRRLVTSHSRMERNTSVDQIRFGVRQNRAVRRGRHAAPNEKVLPDRIFRGVGTKTLSNRPKFPEGIGRDLEAHDAVGQKRRRLAQEGIGSGGRDEEIAVSPVLQGTDDLFPGLDRTHFVEKDGESLSCLLGFLQEEIVQCLGAREAPKGKVFEIEKEEILFRTVEPFRHVLRDQPEETGLSAAAKAGQHFDETVLAVRPNVSQKVGAGKELHGSSPRGPARKDCGRSRVAPTSVCRS